MKKQRHTIDPMSDVVAKKLFSDHEITIDFIETFLGFRPRSVEILNGTLADLKKEREGYFSTVVDVLALTEDGVQVIIEIQVAHQDSFIKRLWTYSCQHLVKDLPNVRDRVKHTHDMYDKIMPVYAIALTASNHFLDDRPIHSFILADSQTGAALIQPFGKEKEDKKVFEMVIVELRKFQMGNIASNQRLWLEFFANQEYSQEKSRVIQKADHLLARNTMTKEELDMIDQWARNASNHYGEIQSGFNRGRREGIQKGRQEGRRDERNSIISMMLRNGATPEQISSLTGIDLKAVQRVQSEQNAGV